jgi:hypothetical protein
MALLPRPTPNQRRSINSCPQSTGGLEIWQWLIPSDGTVAADSATHLIGSEWTVFI